MLEFRDLQKSIASLTEHFFNNLKNLPPLSEGTVAKKNLKINGVERNLRHCCVTFDSHFILLQYVYFSGPQNILIE